MIKQNKDKFIGVRINQDMLIILQAFKSLKGWNYSKTIRIALNHYLEYSIEKEEIVKQNDKK